MNPYARLSTAFLKGQPAAAARVLEEFPAEDVAALLAGLSPVTVQQLIEHMTPHFIANCLAVLEPAEAAHIFSRLMPDIQIPVLRQFEAEQREPLLKALEPTLTASLRRLLPYPDSTAGAFVEAAPASVPEEFSVRDTLKRIKRMKRGMKLYVYATNTRGQLSGVLTLHELINAPPARTIAQVMHRRVVSLSPTQSLQSVIGSPYWQEYHALPVTDDNNVLLGVIRQKSIRRLQERSAHPGNGNSSLGILMTVGELFSITTGHLLSALIATGRSLTQRDSHG